MPWWKFWENDETHEEAPIPSEPMGRFNVRPRTDLIGGSLPSDQDAAARISALRKRRDSVLFDVEQSTLAAEPDNPWLDRVATIDEALAAVEADLARLTTPGSAAPGLPLPPTPVTVQDVSVEPMPRVVIRVGDVELTYEEELDWAERGFQLARTELHLERGDVASLVSGDVGDADRDELVEVLSDSLFRVATEARDQVPAAQSLRPSRRLSELAAPDSEFGGWTDVDRSSPRRRAHALRVVELTAELERLRAERDRELEEMARWRERLPIAQRRLRDVDEQIAAALAGEERSRR